MEFLPAPDKRLHLGIDAKKILHDGRQPFRVAVLLNDAPGIIHLCMIRHRVTIVQAVHAETDQAANVLRPVLVLGAVKVHRLLRIRPRAKKERGHAMVEDIAERRERGVAVMMNPIAGKFSEAKRQRAVRPEEAEVPVVHHRRAGGILLPDRFDG